MEAIESIKSFINLLLCCIPFIGLCIISVKMNLPKEQRYKQVFLPVIALIYCIAGVILLNNISDIILGAIYWLAERFSFLSFLEKVNWAYYSVFVVNTVLVAGFMLVKGLLYPIFLGLFAIPKLADVTSGAFYCITEDENEEGNKKIRYLREKFRDAKKIISSMYWAMLIVFVILLILTYYMTSSKIFSAPFYPAFGIIVLGEVVAFLSGLTRKEKEEEEPPKPEEEPKEKYDYDRLAEKYGEVFGGRLIQTSHENPTPKAEESVGELLQKYKNEYEETLNQDAALLNTYYSNQLEAGKVLDESYIGQTRNILEGKSVIFFSQFYNDTTDYVFLPVVRNLMRRKKILVILGHSGNVDNIKNWFYRGVSAINGFDKIWKVESIANADDDTSVMVLDTKNIYNQKLLNEKAEWLSKVSMVFIIEPNRLLGTLQIGLSCLISYIRAGGNDPQYIIYDRNCDGLVDSLSHVLGKSLVQVNATTVGTANKNMLFWKADGSFLHHKLGMSNSRYLGVGTELSIEALREKVDKVLWVSDHKFPVIDMRWIVSQYYASVCNAASIKVSQNELSEKIKFIEDPWSIEKTEESVIVAEDEFNNAFEIARQFATRGEKESFVNVVSSHYWLRDYMLNNVAIFSQDAKAIPNVTPDYQRNATNVVYKLLMRMIENPVPEDDIGDALDIIGEDTRDPFVSLRKLMLKYFFRVDENSDEAGRYIERIDSALTTESKIVIDKETMRPERKRYYSITNKLFVNEFLSQLKIVYYLAEDEKDKDNFLDSAMYGHVYQKYLPGMLISLDGKCYEIVSMTKNNGILVRRAADHITNRYYYRILRKYKVETLEASQNIRSKYSYGNVSIERLESNIAVDTFGYLKMTEYSNIKDANLVELSNIDPREYRRKECIRLNFAKSTPEIRVTIATLLNELFVSTFPDNYHYIVATAKCPDPEKTKGMIPELEADDDESIYIIEDSLIDLGLLNNVDRYLIRFLEIICDVLDWHKEKLEEEDGEGESEIPEDGEDGEDGEKEKPKKKRRGLFGIIKGWFGRKKKKKKKGEEESEEENDENASISAPPLRSMSASGDILFNSDDDDSGITGDDSEAIKVKGDGSGLPDDDLPYSKSFFLLYGNEAVPEALDLDATLEYLNNEGFGNNYLKQTRKNNNYKKMKWYNYHFENGVHYCDFCGAELVGEFDLLDDGRERCPECTKTAITKVAQFKKLYKKTRKQMERVFDIKLGAKLPIKICNAQKIAEQFGETFVPSPRYDGRTLGFARRYQGSGYKEIYIENGSPEIETMKTLVHELTHIWQYSNMMSLFGDNQDKTVTEGMAVWAEAQFLASIGMKERSDDFIIYSSMRSDEYGIGFRAYIQKYPIVDNERVHKNTPFKCKGHPLK